MWFRDRTVQDTQHVCMYDRFVVIGDKPEEVRRYVHYK